MGLSADQFTSLLDSSSDLKAVASKVGGEVAASAAGEASGLAASVTEKVSAGSHDAIASVGDATKGLDLSSLSQLSGLTKQFEGLGLDAGMVQKFVPALLEQLGPKSGTSGLLKQGLGLL